MELLDSRTWSCIRILCSALTLGTAASPIAAAKAGMSRRGEGSVRVYVPDHSQRGFGVGPHRMGRDISQLNAPIPDIDNPHYVILRGDSDFYYGGVRLGPQTGHLVPEAWGIVTSSQFASVAGRPQVASKWDASERAASIGGTSSRSMAASPAPAATGRLGRAWSTIRALRLGLVAAGRGLSAASLKKSAGDSAGPWGLARVAGSMNQILHTASISPPISSSASRSISPSSLSRARTRVRSERSPCSETPLRPLLQPRTASAIAASDASVADGMPIGGEVAAAAAHAEHAALNAAAVREAESIALRSSDCACSTDFLSAPRRIPFGLHQVCVWLLGLCLRSCRG